MLNDVKPPPLKYGGPEPTDGKPLNTLVSPAPLDTTPYSHTGTVHGARVLHVGPKVPDDHSHQPPAHREVLEGHPDLPRREPQTAHTSEFVHEREHRVGGDSASLNPRVPDPIVRGARRGDIADGGAYEYPSRGSFHSLTLSIVVVVVVLGCVAYLVVSMF